MPLPHKFTDFNTASIRSGVYYKLDPTQSPHAPRKLTNPVYLPVSDSGGGGTNVSYSYQHTYVDSDLSVKNLAGALTPHIPYAETAGKIVQDAAALSLISSYTGSVYLSGCSMYVDSAPTSMSVQSTIFSVGDGKVIKLLEDLRYETMGGFGGGSAVVAKAGKLSVPPWWVVSVVTGDNKIISEAKELICTELTITMMAPFYTSGTPEPSVAKISMGFRGAFRGYAEASKFGA